jgi:uncharacterized membrane protein YeaQ/YmgE (transglycosylase-associated protein family)
MSVLPRLRANAPHRPRVLPAAGAPRGGIAHRGVSLRLPSREVGATPAAQMWAARVARGQPGLARGPRRRLHERGRDKTTPGDPFGLRPPLSPALQTGHCPCSCVVCLAMSLLELIVYFAIAVVCVGAAHAITGDTPRGLMYVVLLGFVGALLGTWVAHGLRLPELLTIGVGRGNHVPLLWSVLGCAALVALAHLIRPPISPTRR